MLPNLPVYKTYTMNKRLMLLKNSLVNWAVLWFNELCMINAWNVEAFKVKFFLIWTNELIRFECDCVCALLILSTTLLIIKSSWPIQLKHCLQTTLPTTKSNAYFYRLENCDDLSRLKVIKYRWDYFRQ